MKVQVGPHPVAPLAAGAVVGQDRLAVDLPYARRGERDPEGRDVLDPVQAEPDRLGGIDDLEMPGHRHVAGVGRIGHRLDQVEGKPEVDLDRRRPLRDRVLGPARRLDGTEHHPRVLRIRGARPIEMRPGQRHARPLEPVPAHHLLEAVELLDPLPGIAEGRDAVRQVPQREAGVVFDVIVVVDQARKHERAGQIQAARTGGLRDLGRRPDRFDALTADYDPAAGARRPAGAVEDGGVVEDDRGSGVPLAGPRARAHQEGQAEYQRKEISAHFQLLIDRNSARQRIAPGSDSSQRIPPYRNPAFLRSLDRRARRPVLRCPPLRVVRFTRDGPDFPPPRSCFVGPSQRIDIVHTVIHNGFVWMSSID
ncbi:MAG: hypothetical protein DMG07_22710 [Acidobacteria bacterium]|nr:MAG: hypothetical protein DMG07_22710 [Acidobacteriota bacterium]